MVGPSLHPSKKITDNSLCPPGNSNTAGVLDIHMDKQMHKSTCKWWNEEISFFSSKAVLHDELSPLDSVTA